MLLVVLEHDRGTIADASFEALTAGRELAAALAIPMHAVSIGTDLSASAAEYGATTTHVVSEPMLDDYGPEAWGEALAQLVDTLEPVAVVACGTDRGQEVLAQLAARRDLAMVANCTEVQPGEPWLLTRARWGGSLLEEATLTARIKVLTFVHHAIEATVAPVAATSVAFTPSLDPSLARTVVRDRIVRTAGVTLSTARVVVGGGRGVGSADGFAPLEALAAELSGVVGCSRAVTNNGWRNHTDQVGQTGTRIAPDIYIACGISGAIQHWVGAMASKNILAINTDREANMVSKAGYAVIGDLHQVIPAITDELRRRRG